ncbi:hypothetical protein ACT3SQ_01835 [Brachybacterium sp. AOP42-C2-15]|uniref:hypothetical protein n=1 Tax=unclassified Brachybacterium TaxID=2623841 RepID=UPI003F9806F3
MNAPEHPERPERPERAERSERPERAEPAGRDESDTPDGHQVATPQEATREDAPEADDPATATAEPDETSIYVRRSRTPTLGFWVAVAIALPAVAALISAPFFDFADLGGVLNFVLLAAVIVGLPLATIAAVIDSVRHRRKSSPER